MNGNPTTAMASSAVNSSPRIDTIEFVAALRTVLFCAISQEQQHRVETMVMQLRFRKRFQFDHRSELQLSL